MLELLITSSVLILTVLALRLALRGRLDPRLRYALWALVLLRLLVPVNFFTSSVSVLNALPAEPRTVTAPAIETDREATPYPVNDTGSDIAWTPGPGLTPTTAQTETAPPAPPEMPAATATAALSTETILLLIWAGGAAALGAVILGSNLVFSLRLRRSRRRLETEMPLPVYVSPAAPTPCLVGLFRPKIYVTQSAAADHDTLRRVLAHEGTHHRHGDHVWSLLRCLCLAVYWFHPLVWVAAVLSKRDAELACDASTIRTLGEAERLDYGRTLIDMTAERGGNVLRCATTMSGGKRTLKERITTIAKRPKTALWAVAAVVIIVLAAAACTFTGADSGDAPQTDVETDTENVRVFYRDNTFIGIPEAQMDHVLVDTEGEPTGSWLLYLHEKESYEFGMEEYDVPLGFLLAVLKVDAVQYQEFLSSDGSGISFFARDDEYYYGFQVATDAQWFTIEDGERFQALLEDLRETISADMIVRNDLTPYSDREFFDRAYTYDSEHVLIAVDLPAPSAGETYTLTLSQPATKGDTGIWCVERWQDQYNNTYYVFPEGMEATIYYRELQDACDLGRELWRLNPMSVAMDLVENRLGLSNVTAHDLRIVGEPTATYDPESLEGLDSLTDDELLEYFLNADGAYTEGSLWYIGQQLLGDHTAGMLRAMALRAPAEQELLIRGIAGYLTTSELVALHDKLAEVRRSNSVPAVLEVLEKLDGAVTAAIADSYEGERVMVTADLTGSGREDDIVLGWQQGGQLYTLSVRDEQGNDRWSGTAALAHVGWNAYYLCTLDDGNYILEYNPSMFQGSCDYYYNLIEIGEGTPPTVIRSGSVRFDVNGWEPLPVDNMVAFADEVNELLRHSTLLLSTRDGVAVAYGGDGIKLLEEAYDFLYGDPIPPDLYGVNDTLQTKLEKFSEYMMEYRDA